MPPGYPGPGTMVAAPPGMGYPGVNPGEPMPLGFNGIPGLGAGPGGPGGGMPCPPGVNPITLTMDGTANAFEGENPYCCQPGGLYVSVGGIGMSRQRPTHTWLVNLDPGIQLNGTTQFVDTGNLPPWKAQQPFDMHDIRPNYNWGVKTTLGYRCDEFCAFEVTGYYLAPNDSFVQAAVPGRLDLPFDINPTPIGFQGNNGLWSQADVVRASLQSQLGSAEANFRYRPAGGKGSGIDLLVGLRYLDYFERFGLYTGDDDLTASTFNIFGAPDQRVQALYQASVHNHILAAQLGFDAQWQCHPNFTFGWAMKGAWGTNFLETDIRLVRGDGFVGINTKRNQEVFSMLYESNFYLDVAIGDRVHLRGGYNLLWLVDIAQAEKQLDFNLANIYGRQRHNDSSLFQGPTMELQINF